MREVVVVLNVIKEASANGPAFHVTKPCRYNVIPQQGDLVRTGTDVFAVGRRLWEEDGTFIRLYLEDAEPDVVTDQVALEQRLRAAGFRDPR
jgi:hypothetical protein